MKLVILLTTFLLAPALSFARGCNPGDVNCEPGFSDQIGNSRVDIGGHAQTSANVDMVNSMLSGMKGALGGLGSPNTSGVVVEKQAANSLTRKGTKIHIKPGDDDSEEANNGQQDNIQ